jgi:hypothetical protein
VLTWLALLSESAVGVQRSGDGVVLAVVNDPLLTWARPAPQPPRRWDAPSAPGRAEQNFDALLQKEHMH